MLAYISAERYMGETESLRTPMNILKFLFAIGGLFGIVVLSGLQSGCHAEIKKLCSEGPLKVCVEEVGKYPKETPVAVTALQARCVNENEACNALIAIYTKANRMEDAFKLLAVRCDAGDTRACDVAASLTANAGNPVVAVKSLSVSCVKGSRDACQLIQQLATQCNDQESCGNIADSIQEVNNQVSNPTVASAHFAVVDKLCHSYHVGNSCLNAARSLASSSPPRPTEALEHLFLACKYRSDGACQKYQELIVVVSKACLEQRDAESCEVVGLLLIDPESPLPTMPAEGRRMLRTACAGNRAKACSKCQELPGCCVRSIPQCRQ